MALRAQNTMSELINGMLGDIGQAKAMPDADLAFLTELETMLLGKARASVDATQGVGQQAGSQGPGGMDMGGGPVPGMGPGSTPPMPMGPPPGMGGMPPGDPSMTGAPIGGGPPGLPMRPAAPNPDELRRLLNAGPS